MPTVCSLACAGKMPALRLLNVCYFVLVALSAVSLRPVKVVEFANEESWLSERQGHLLHRYKILSRMKACLCYSSPLIPLFSPCS